MTNQHWTRSARVRVLAAVNVCLMGLALVVAFGPAATAQSGGQSRPRGSYLLVGGQVISGDSNAVYLVDTSNQEMVALRWDEGARRVEGLGYRDLRSDAAGETTR
ncbi:MAG: hypothetical protein AAF235_05910 [Planctomycetota bacterium]